MSWTSKQTSDHPEPPADAWALPPEHPLARLIYAAPMVYAVRACAAGGWAYCSASLPAVLGYSIDELMTEGGEFFNRRMHPGDAMQLREPLRQFEAYVRAAADSAELHLEWMAHLRLRHSAGHWVWVRQRLQPLEFGHKGPRYCLELIEDISALKRDEVVMAQAHVGLNGHRRSLLHYTSSAQWQARLTERERETLRLLAVGHTSKEAAQLMCVSEATAVTYRKSLLRKMNCKNLAALLELARRQALV